MTAATKSSNRAVTLIGANKIFGAIGVEIHQHALGFYFAEMRGQRYEKPTLTELCQAMICALDGAANAALSSN
ncbi:MAG TPA: hypothetical protein V6D06_16990 [Trichocoleus sp.]